METWHEAISLHRQLILALRHTAVPCEPTSHHAPDIPSLSAEKEKDRTHTNSPLFLPLKL